MKDLRDHEVRRIDVRYSVSAAGNNRRLYDALGRTLYAAMRSADILPAVFVCSEIHTIKLCVETIAHNKR